jgi:hypothetical protein
MLGAAHIPSGTALVRCRFRSLSYPSQPDSPCRAMHAAYHVPYHHVYKSSYSLCRSISVQTGALLVAEAPATV